MDRGQIEQRMAELQKRDAMLGEQAELVQKELAARQKALAEISTLRTRLYGAHEELAELLKETAPLHVAEPEHDGE